MGMDGGPIKSTFDNPTKERQWSDIADALTQDEPGWLAGTFFMESKLPSKRQIVIRSNERSQLKITISCPGFEQLQFRSYQRLKILLKGAALKEAKTSAPNFLPFILLFETGVAILFDEAELVDLWQKSDPAEVRDQDWFSTPHVDPHELDTREQHDGLASSPARETEVIHDKSFPDSGNTPASTPPPQTPRLVEHALTEPTLSSGNDVEVEDSVEGTVQQELSQEKEVCSMDVDGRVGDAGTNEPSVQRQGGKKRKKRDTRHDPTRESKKRRTAEPALGEPRTDPQEIPGKDIVASGELSKAKLSKAEKKRRRTEFVNATTNSAPSPSPPKRNPALDLNAGCSTENGAYPALSDINESKVNTFTQVIGIVAKIEPIKKTRTSDVSLSITLIDPSNFQVAGFKVTCFMKATHERFLPTPAVGHVLLLKSVKLSLWGNNVNGTIYPEKLCWVAFNPDTGKFYHKDDAVISAQTAATGLSASFNPFHHPKGKEVEYFVRLGEWWRVIQEEQEKGAIQIQDYSRRGRSHALIGDMAPNDFFDSTVEVVMRARREDLQDAFMLLSDFTPHSSRSTEGPFGQWAISAYTSVVHAELLEQMQVGTFWDMKNVRLKISSIGNIEFDLYAAELRELSTDEAEEERHLQALLERRKKYIEDHPFELNDKSQRGDAASTLVSDISGPGYYTFIAGLVYRSYQNGTKDVTDLYVTDYTDNQRASCYKTEGLKRRLKGEPVFRIAYFGNPDDIRNLEERAIYKFGDVRISTDQSGALRGTTNNADSNIRKVSLRKISDPDVAEFLKRREAFSAGQIQYKSTKDHGDALPSLSSPSLLEHASTRYDEVAVTTRHQDQLLTSIGTIRTCDKCPNKFRLKAQVVEFWPLNLEDFTVRRCKSCKKRIPDNRYACTMCDDMEQKLVQWVYHFALRLRDEDGETIDVAVCDEGKQFLAGLPACDLMEEDNVKTLRSRLRGLFGNLFEVHDGLRRQEKVDPKYGPWTDFAIKSWKINVDQNSFVVYAITGSQINVPSDS